jgi:hypothetical protein
MGYRFYLFQWLCRLAALWCAFLVGPAAAYENPPLLGGAPGLIEMAGCTVIPGQQAFHYCTHEPLNHIDIGETMQSACLPDYTYPHPPNWIPYPDDPNDPHFHGFAGEDSQGGWNGSGWSTILGGSHKGYEVCPYLYCNPNDTVRGPSGYCYVAWDDFAPASHEADGQLPNPPGDPSTPVCHHGRGAESGAGHDYGCPRDIVGGSTTGTIHRVCGDFLDLVVFLECAEGGYSAETSWWIQGIRLVPDADFNGDTIVSILDFGVMMQHFGHGHPAPGDADGDGQVSIIDYGIWAAYNSRRLTCFTQLGHKSCYYNDRNMTDIPGSYGGIFGRGLHIWMQQGPP